MRTALDGPAALRMADTFRPDAAVLDIGLPVMSGYEVAQRMRQVAGLERIVLVAVTGYGQEEDHRQAKSVGFDAHLVKPASIEALAAVLRRVDTRQPGGTPLG